MLVSDDRWWRPRLDFRSDLGQEARMLKREGTTMGRGMGVLAGLLAVSLAAPAGAAMTTEQRLRALENLVHEQQEEIKALKGELKQQKAIGTATQQQAERAEESSKATDKKVVASIPEWVSKITP